jgi:hypothetical protein
MGVVQVGMYACGAPKLLKYTAHAVFETRYLHAVFVVECHLEFQLLHLLWRGSALQDICLSHIPSSQQLLAACSALQHFLGL